MLACREGSGERSNDVFSELGAPGDDPRRPDCSRGRAGGRSGQEPRDARAAAGTERHQWVRERRERVYVQFLEASGHYVKSLPKSDPFKGALFVHQEIGEVNIIGVRMEASAGPGDDGKRREELAWQALADSVAPIQTYGSDEVREAAADLLRLLAELRSALKGDVSWTIEGTLGRAAAAEDETDVLEDAARLRVLARRVRGQRDTILQLIRKELDLVG